MVEILILLNMITVIFVIYKYNFKEKCISVNHNLLFSIGYVIYCIFPIIFGWYHLFNTQEYYEKWFSIFDKISTLNICIYLISMYAFYITFIYFSNKHPFSQNYEINSSKTYSKYTFRIVFLVLAIVCCLFLIKYSDSFFSGYNEMTLNMSYKGQFTALTVLYFSVLMFYYVNRVHRENTFFYKLIIHPYSILYYIIAICNLSMGGRLYLFSQILCLVVFYCYYYKNIKLSYILLGAITAILIFAIIGLWRNETTFNVQNLISGNLVAEPIFTSYSLIKTLELGEFTIIRLPIVLLSYLINLIPTAIFPTKLNYLLSAQDFGFTVYNPVGAFHIFTSLMVNFGIIGSILFAGLLGFMFNMLNRKNNIICPTIYILLSGYITFTFFRDGFETSLIKNMLEFSILIPLIVYYFCSFSDCIIKKIEKRCK